LINLNFEQLNKEYLELSTFNLFSNQFSIDYSISPPAPGGPFTDQIWDRIYGKNTEHWSRFLRSGIVSFDHDENSLQRQNYSRSILSEAKKGAEEDYWVNELYEDYNKKS
jgi:hypothetical protein